MTRGLDFELRGVSVRFRSTIALDGVDLSIGAGEAVALVGPSGAGKSTLLRLLNGALRPSAGQVRVEGRDLATLGARSMRALRARVGFVHQGFELVPGLRVVHNVLAGGLGSQSFAASLWSMVVGARREHRRVHELLERLGIGAKIYEPTERLSGGQQQRVAIARALYGAPRAVLADEPVSAVDPARSRDVIRLLIELSRSSSITLCASLHDLDLALATFPRIVGLRAGRVAFDTRPADLDARAIGELFELSGSESRRDG